MFIWLLVHGALLAAQMTALRTTYKRANPRRTGIGLHTPLALAAQILRRSYVPKQRRAALIAI